MFVCGRADGLAPTNIFKNKNSSHSFHAESLESFVCVNASRRTDSLSLMEVAATRRKRGVTARSQIIFFLILLFLLLPVRACQWNVPVYYKCRLFIRPSVWYAEKSNGNQGFCDIFLTFLFSLEHCFFKPVCFPRFIFNHWIVSTKQISEI